MGLHFFIESAEVWGIQYHPDYFYEQTINLTKLRKQKLIENNYFYIRRRF